MGRLARGLALVPWTPFGLAVGVAAVLGDRFFAAPRSDYVIRVVAGTSLGLVLATGLAVALGAFALRRRLARAGRPEMAGEAEQGAVLGLACSPLPLLRVDVRWRTAMAAHSRLAIGPTGALEERVRFGGRGRVGHVERAWRVEDPFGLARVRWTEVRRQEVRIAPWRGGLDRCPELRALARGEVLPHPAGSAEGDRMDLRPYQPGDPIRLVAWKTYARTGELDVRMAERALSPQRRTAAFLIAGPDDEPAAAAAWVAIERGLLGPSWVFGTAGSEPTSDPEAARTAILDCAGARPDGDAGLVEFAARVRRQGPAHVLVFAPGRPGPWLESALAAAGPDCLLVAVVDGMRPTVEVGPWWRRPSADGAPRLWAAPTEVDAVCSDFERRGAAAVALARVDGRVLRRSQPKRWVA